ncbi:hypothetical protein WJX72_007011 [[Myrmecia] bisecta]|uniref:Nuclear pore complex protein Nup205 n=1 Tax=[Myrmecia] bisecta TaxID=41462 RepID=A0AAW1R7N1_9CHLO
MASYRELLAFVEGVVSGALQVDAASVAFRLQAQKHHFLNLLQELTVPSNAATRQQIQSKHPALASGQVQLDDGDVREVLLLSDELKLDELVCLQCIITAQDERGQVSAEAAAGIYFEERRALLATLWTLLQATALPAQDLDDSVNQMITDFVLDLLAQRINGHAQLLTRLIDLVKDVSLEPQAGSRLTRVLDFHDELVDRRLLLQRERTLLCESLAYVCSIQQRQMAGDIASLADLLHTLGLRARGTEAGDITTFQQTYIVLTALLAVLLPRESSVEGPDVEADNQALGALASDGQLASKFESSSPPEDGWQASSRLAWGLLLAEYGQSSMRERALNCLRLANQVGTFHFLDAGVLASTAFQDDHPYQKDLYARILHQLAMQYLDSDLGREQLDSLIQVSVEQAHADPAKQAGRPDHRDSLATLLNLIAALYTINPDLWLDEETRYAVLGEFMEYIARHSILQEAPPVLVGYLAVLTALASSEKGAQAMFLQLRQDTRTAPISWHRMFDVMMKYCARFTADSTRQVAVGESAAQAVEFMLPQSDAQGLAAYVRLFARVIQEGSEADVVAWVHTLEEDIQASPLWEVLFQLMCHPVPQELKAALDEAIAAFASKPEFAGQLWERLVSAVVVQPLTPADTQMAGPLPRYDITYQLHEIEARAEDYSETLAFLKLLNNLLRSSGTLLPDEGRPFAHFTQFVKDDVLGQLMQRAYKHPKQKWELAAACLEHLRLAILSAPALYAGAGPLPSIQAAHDASAVQPPALLVLLDLLSERTAMRAVMAVLGVGVDALSEERKDTEHGAAKEAALLAALNLIATALDCDQTLVSSLHQSDKSGRYETLDVALKADRRRLPLLLDFVRYPWNPAVQAQAIRISQVLVDRLPGLLDILLQAQPGVVPLYQRIRSGFASSLQESLFRGGASAGSGEGGGEDEDGRAALILQLVLRTLDDSTPNMAQLLMGYAVENGPEGVYNSLLDPKGVFSCLPVILEAAFSATLPAVRPQLYEQALEVVTRLAAHPDTGPAMLDLLRLYQAAFPAQLDTVAATPPGDKGPGRVAQLHQQAWLLQLIGLQLHHADPAVPAHRQSCAAILHAIFTDTGDSEAAPEDAMEQRRSRILEVLEGVAYPLAEPQISAESLAEARRLQQRMGVDALLASRAGVQEDGVRLFTDRGLLCYDLPALTNVLRQRYTEQEADSRRYPGTSAAASSDDLREACRAVMRYAQKYNAFVEESGAQVAVLQAWQMVLEVAITRRYDLLLAGGPASGMMQAGSNGQMQRLHLVTQLLDTVLDVAAECLNSDAVRLAPALCQVVRTLLARLHEQGSSQGPLRSTAQAQALAGLRLPAKCHDILRRLLGLLRDASKVDAARIPLCGALLNYLSFCRPATTAASMREGARGIDASAALLDQAQTELEEGNAAILREQPGLVHLILQDAASTAADQDRVLALALAATLVSLDTSLSIAELRLPASHIIPKLTQAKVVDVMVEEAGFDDLYTVVEERPRLHASMESQPAAPSGSALQVFKPQGGANGPGASIQHQSTTTGQYSYDRQVASLLYLIEHSLAILLVHLRHHATELGSTRELDQLRRVLMPTLEHLERLQDGSLGPAHDLAALHMFVRRCKEALRDVVGQS